MSENGDLTERTLGEFKLLRRLGRGGMAEVYLAEQTSLKRHVAIKVMRPDLVRGRDDVMLQRFKQEATAAAALVHPNIVQVYTIGEEDGFHFIAQEYVQGRNLAEFLKSKGPPELPAALHIMRQVASALKAAGAAGIVHRDIKPENIMLTKKGEVKVADFGLAQLTERPKDMSLTQQGTTLGTPLYMSPEQVTGKPLDKRSDLYSLGVTCYHMFSGNPPFVGTSAMAIAIQHVNDLAPPLSERAPKLPIVLCRLVNRLMAKNPDLRYPSADYVLQDIRELARAIKEKKDLGTVRMPILDKLDAHAAKIEQKRSAKTAPTANPASTPLSESLPTLKPPAAKTAPGFIVAKEASASPAASVGNASADSDGVAAAGRSKPTSSGTRSGRSSSPVLKSLDPSADKRGANPISTDVTSAGTASTSAPRTVADGDPRATRQTIADGSTTADRPPGAPRGDAPAPLGKSAPIKVPRKTDPAPRSTAVAKPRPREVDEEEFTMRKAAMEVEEMDLTPMVDVTFLLLIFFMITASFTLQKSIAVPPPESDGAAAAPKPMDEIEAESVEVFIDDQNTIVVDNETEVADADELLDILGDKLVNEKRNELLVKADKRALHEFVVLVIDTGKEAGMEKIRIAVSEDD